MGGVISQRNFFLTFLTTCGFVLVVLKNDNDDDDELSFCVQIT